MSKITYPKTMTSNFYKKFMKDRYYSDYFKSIISNKIQEGKIKLVK